MAWIDLDQDRIQLWAFAMMVTKFFHNLYHY
jgi:hypothetical protein